VLLTSTWAAKVADFGTSKAYGVDLGAETVSERLNFVSRAENKSHIIIMLILLFQMTMAGTPIYMAPEVVRGERYNRSSDVYGFAIILLAMGCEKGDAFAEFVKAVEQNRKFRTSFSADLTEIQEHSSINIMKYVADFSVRPNLFASSFKNMPDTIKNLIASNWDDRAKNRMSFLQITVLLNSSIRSELEAGAKELQEQKKKTEEEKLEENKKYISAAR